MKKANTSPEGSDLITALAVENPEANAAVRASK
eukprot:IDg10923t1